LWGKAMGANLAESLVVFSILAFVAFLIWNRTRANLERQRLQLDTQAQILDRIGPGQALTDFLKTAEGKQFFDRLTTPQAAPTRSKDVRTRILVLTTLGLIALFAGFFFVMAVLIPNLLVQDSTLQGSERLMAFVPVIFLTGGGVGALLAAWIMHRLSKKWGMLGAEERNERTD
jgi:sterol desaturase/sphingolipid hydroxylase (fatty acid hydroxylase superfamily)